MTDPVRIIDHVARALLGLLPRWRNSDTVRELTAAFVEELQELEDLYFDLIVERFLSSAIGAQLDDYALLVGLERNGRTDDELRALVRAKMLANRGGKTPPVVAEVAARLFCSGEPFGVKYDHLQPAAYQLAVTPFEEGPDLHTESNAVSVSSEAASASGWAASGVSLGIDSTDAQSGSFSFKGTAVGATLAYFLYQLTTVAGRTYRVRFYVKTRTGSDQRIAEWFGVESSPSVKVQASTEWQFFEFDVVATGVVIQFRFYTNFTSGAVGDQLSLDTFEVHELDAKTISAGLVKEAIAILLEATPAGVAIAQVTQNDPDGNFRFGDGTVGPTGFGNAGFAKVLAIGD